MRTKAFFLNDKEDIVGMVYVPGQRIIIEVGMGNAINGKFAVAPNQNYEQYILDMSGGLENNEPSGLEKFEANVQIMELVDRFKNYCWDNVVVPARLEIEKERNNVIAIETVTGN